MMIVDFIIISIIILFGCIGFLRGFFKEIASLVGIIIVFFLSFILKVPIFNFMIHNLPFFNFKYDILNVLLYNIISYLIVFIVLYIIYSMVIQVFKIIDKIVKITIILEIPSKILGTIIGLIKGYIICFIILLLLEIPLGDNELYHNSKLKNNILYKTPVLSDQTKVNKTLKEIYDISKDIINEEEDYAKENKKIIETILKYDIIDNKTLKELQKQGKIKEEK